MALKYKIEFIILFCLADFHITASFSSSFYVLIQLIHINKKNGLCAARIRLLLFTSALFSNDDLRLILLFYLSFSCSEEKKNYRLFIGVHCIQRKKGGEKEPEWLLVIGLTL